MADTDEEELIEKIMDEIQPELVELVERYSVDERETALMAIASFGVYFLGRFSGNDVAREFAQLMVERASDINNDPIKVRKYDA